MTLPAWTRRGILIGESEADPEQGFYIPAGMEELVDIERRNWKRDMREIEGPVAMPAQGFRAMFPNNQEAPITNSTQVAAAADTILWDPAGIAPQTAIPANSLYADAILKVTAWGVNTTAVTGSQTAIFTPRFGTTVSGTSLGVSRTMPVNAAVVTTQPFYCELYFHCRLVGSAGTATAGGWIGTQSVIGTAATTNTSNAFFGTSSTTATTINTTTASGLLVSVNCSLNTNTYQTLGVVMESLN